jgi:hypothetical protein
MNFLKVDRLLTFLRWIYVAFFTAVVLPKTEYSE